jgi:hypothetical protein
MAINLDGPYEAMCRVFGVAPNGTHGVAMNSMHLGVEYQPETDSRRYGLLSVGRSPAEVLHVFGWRDAESAGCWFSLISTRGQSTAPAL